MTKDFQYKKMSPVPNAMEGIYIFIMHKHNYTPENAMGLLI